MIKKITASGVKGFVNAPASKSVAQRAIAIAALAEGESLLRFPGDSDDVLAAINICKAFGAQVTHQDDYLTIQGGLKPPSQPLDCGEAGLGIRMFSALAATLNAPVTLTGSGSLATRPMDMIQDSLRAAGVQCETQNGLLPVMVKGPLVGGVAHIDGSVSSQVLTGLLIAAPYALKPAVFRVHDLKSRPYVDITLQMMKDFGVEVENRNYEEFFVPAPVKYTAREYAIEGDWSGAAFMLVAAAIAGELEIRNLNPQSPQADRAILEAIKSSGASLQIMNEKLMVKKAPLQAFTFDATHCPDLFPPLVALAAACEGTTRIQGVSRLRVKESDRAIALQQEFGKMGVAISFNDDWMHIVGGPVQGATVHSHHDHRIAMACATVALIAQGPVVIEEAEAVAKSYPEFYEDLEGVRSGG